MLLLSIIYITKILLFLSNFYYEQMDILDGYEYPEHSFLRGNIDQQILSSEMQKIEWLRFEFTIRFKYD